MIARFSGEYRFLSNFWFCNVLDSDGTHYRTVEHYFQAMKCADPEDAREVVAAPKPQDARRIGKSVLMRPDWDVVKLPVMRDALRLKFYAGGDLAALLVETAPHALQEGNHWGDRFWGVDGHGQNWLGVLLMARRAELMDGL